MAAHLEFDVSDEKVAERITHMRSSPVRDLFSAATRSDIISLSGGMPDVSLLPEDAVRRAVNAAVDDPQARAVGLQYGATNGSLEMREVVCDIIRDSGIRSKPDNVVLTTGAQEALDLIAKTFINEGDIIITEGLLGKWALR